MESQFLETEFTVVDQIEVDHKWARKYPEWKGFCDGKLLVLTPPCACELDLGNLSAFATTPSGKEVPLAFDKVIVNKSGCVGLFFEGIFTKTVPKDSRVRFMDAGNQAVNDDAQYLSQGKLEVPDADKILPRLEKEGIRFQIDTDVSAYRRGFNEARIELFIHVDDVPAWKKYVQIIFPSECVISSPQPPA